MGFELRSQDKNKTITESTKVARPKVIPIKTDRQKESERLSLMKEKAGDIKQLGSKAGIDERKNVDQLLNPLTAFGYAARNEEMPKNFGKGPRNILDNVVDIVNPFFYAEKGLSAIGNTVSGVSNIAKGKYPSAKRDFKNAAIDAFEVLPAAAEIKSSMKVAKGVSAVEKIPVKTYVEPVGIKSIKKVMASLPEKKVSKWTSLNNKWTEDVENSYEKIGEMTGKYLKKFELKHGSSYSQRDANLFARLEETKRGKTDPLVASEVQKLSDQYRYADQINISKSSVENRIKQDNAFETKHGIDRSTFTKTDELLNNVYSQGYDSKINGRTAHIDGVVNKKFYKKDVIPKLESLVTKNKLKSEETLFRGDHNYKVGKVWRDGKKLPKGSVDFVDLKEGDVWKPGSFVSTSTSKGVAEGFGNITSEIKAPTGQSTLYSNAVKGGRFTSEKEVLLPSKLKFKVEGKTGTNGNINFKQSIVNPYTITGAIGGSMMFSGNKKK